MSSVEGKQRTTRHENKIGRTLQDGEYRIEAVLGHGGMGQVFLASYASLDIPVALKQVRGDQPLPESVIEELDRILHSKGEAPPTQNAAFENDFPVSGGTNTDRFLREALLLARLHHPALPTLFDYFFEDGYWYLVMEYIPGPTLATYIRQHAPLAPLEAINYAMQLCDVLDYFHKQAPPVIFRDLKPSNVLLNADGRLMLVDFGIARYFKAGQVNDTTDFGSPGYASPEQYQGIGQTDARSDLYSLGVILHEMISGLRPVGIGDKLKMLRQINPDLSPVLSALVNVGVRQEPMYRFQSAHTFYQALERARAIEERRAYQQRILEAKQRSEMQKISSQTLHEPEADTPGLGENEQAIPLSPHSSLQKTQRIYVRESQSQARREQLEKEALEIQLVSVDEDLKKRSLSGILPTSPPILPTPLPIVSSPPPVAEDEKDLQISHRSKNRTRRAIYTCFVLALMLVLILASLFSYTRLYHSSYKTSQDQGATSTPGSSTTDASSWQVLPSFPSPEADNTAVFVRVESKAYIYMSGGYRGSENVPHYDRALYRYDIGAAHWETVKSKDFPGMVNNAVALDEQNNLYYTVGYSSDTYALTSTLYQYQPDTGKLQKIIPPPQIVIGFGAAMIADHQGHLYITQGFLKAGNSHVLANTGWYRYEIDSGKWQHLAPQPIGLGYTVLDADGQGGILMFAGSKDAGQHLPVQQIYRYDIGQNTWTLENAYSPSAFSGAASCQDTHGNILIVGGYDAIHAVNLNQTWLVNARTLEWKPLAALPSGGSLLGAAACDNVGHVYLVRGANDPNRPTRDFWELSLNAGE